MIHRQLTDIQASTKHGNYWGSQHRKQCGTLPITHIGPMYWINTHGRRCWQGQKHPNSYVSCYKFPGYHHTNKRKWKMSFDMRLQIHQYTSDQTHWSILWAVAWIQLDEHHVRIYRLGIILWRTFSCMEDTQTHWRSHLHISYCCSITPTRLGSTDKLFSLFRIFQTYSTNIRTHWITTIFSWISNGWHDRKLECDGSKNRFQAKHIAVREL